VPHQMSKKLKKARWIRQLIFQSRYENTELGNEMWNTGFVPAVFSKTIKSVSIDLAFTWVQIYFPEQLLEYETEGNRVVGIQDTYNSK